MLLKNDGDVTADSFTYQLRFEFFFSLQGSLQAAYGRIYSDGALIKHMLQEQLAN